MQDILRTVASVHLANTFDFVSGIPPNQEWLAPVIPLLPDPRLLSWLLWLEVPTVFLQDASGNLTPNQRVNLDTDFVFSFAVDCIGGLPLPPSLTHPIDVYGARALAAAPQPVWPLTAADYAILQPWP